MPNAIGRPCASPTLLYYRLLLSRGGALLRVGARRGTPFWKGGRNTMRRLQTLASAAAVALAMLLAGPARAAEPAKPAGEMTYALYVTIPPAWMDPGEATQ